MKIDEAEYSSNVLYGKDLEDSIIAKIVSCERTVFDEGTKDERRPLELGVSSDELNGDKVFTLNKKNTKTIVEAYGDDTDKWTGKELRLTPVAAHTPDGIATTSIAVGIPKSKKG